MRRDQLVIFQDEFRINRVAGGLVNLVAAEVTIAFVFVIVVAAEVEFLAIGGEFLLFIQLVELRFTPRLARAPDITPELEIRFIIAASDNVIAWHFRGMLWGHRHFRRLYAG